MKKIILLLIALLSGALVNAQDVIILTNGNEILSKIIEIGTSEIKYKKSDNPNGPLISVSKYDVFMIKYENGTKEMINQNSSIISSPVKVKTPQKLFTAIFSGGVSVPLGSFGRENNYDGGARIGFTVAHQGDIYASGNTFFTYSLIYSYHPYEITYYLYDPFGGPSFAQTVNGSYNIFFSTFGCKFKTEPAPSRFFGLIDVGLNVTNMTSTPYEFNNTTGTSFAIAIGAGAEILKKINLTIKFINARPALYENLNIYYYEESKNIGLYQLLAGYQF